MLIHERDCLRTTKCQLESPHIGATISNHLLVKVDRESIIIVAAIGIVREAKLPVPKSSQVSARIGKGSTRRESSVQSPLRMSLAIDIADTH